MSDENSPGSGTVADDGHGGTLDDWKTYVKGSCEFGRSHLESNRELSVSLFPFQMARSLIPSLHAP